MSYYRFHLSGTGIYHVVNKMCPKDDLRRKNKPDGLWLAKAGLKFPGSISFWTEKGLVRYLESGLCLWHLQIVGVGCEVITLDQIKNQLYSDPYQVLTDKIDLRWARSTSAHLFLKSKLT